MLLVSKNNTAMKHDSDFADNPDIQYTHISEQQAFKKHEVMKILLPFLDLLHMPCLMSCFLHSNWDLQVCVIFVVCVSMREIHH